jgi:hypothetical protein
MSNYTTKTPIFNSNPPPGKPRQCGWKTVCGYDHQAKKLAYCLKTNARHACYTWHATININKVLTDDEHKAIWKTASRELRKHITAFYIREPSEANHCNYHLIVNSRISKERLGKCIRNAFPTHANITSTVAPIYSLFALCEYVCKHGRYKDRRLYFSIPCTLNKHGAIGQFWHRSQEQLWAACIKTERQLHATLNDGYDVIQPASKYLHWCCDGYIPFKRIRRSLTRRYPGNESTLEDLAERWRSVMDTDIYL